MKHRKLHAVAHNFAASLSGGLSFVVPNYVLQTHVYAEAAATKDGVLRFDFLTGATNGAFPGGEIEQLAGLFKAAFPAFCAKHGVDRSDYHACFVDFMAMTRGNRFVITLEDRSGRQTTRGYDGRAGNRLMTSGGPGRVRPIHLPPPTA